MKKKTMVGLIAIVAIVAVLIFAGSVGDIKERPSAPVSTQGLEYGEWVVETLSLEYGHTLLLSEASERKDLASVERYAGMLYDDAERALNEIDQFSVSPKLQPSKDEFKLMLQDLKEAGYYYERGQGISISMI